MKVLWFLIGILNHQIVSAVVDQTQRICNLKNAYRLYYDSTQETADKSSFICSNTTCALTDPACERVSEITKMPMYFNAHFAVFGASEGLPIYTLIVIRLNNLCYLEIPMERIRKSEINFTFRVCKYKSSKLTCDVQQQTNFTDVKTSFMVIKILDNSTFWFKFQPKDPKPFSLRRTVDGEQIVTIETKCDLDTKTLPSITYTFNHTYYPEEMVYDSMTLMVPPTKYGYIDVDIKDDLENGSILVKPTDTKDNNYYCDFIGVSCKTIFAYPPGRIPRKKPSETTGFDPTYYNSNSGFDYEQPERVEKCDVRNGYTMFKEHLSKEVDNAAFYCSNATCDFTDLKCERKSETLEIPMYFRFHEVVFGVPQGLPIYTLMVIQINEFCYVEISMKRTTKSDLKFKFLVCAQQKRMPPNWNCIKKQEISFANVETSFLAIKLFRNSTMWFKFQPSNPTPFSLKTVVKGEKTVIVKTDCVPDSTNLLKIKYNFTHIYYPREIVHEGVVLMLPITKFGFVKVVNETVLSNGSLVVKPDNTEENAYYCDLMEINCNTTFIYPPDRRPDEPPGEKISLEPFYKNNQQFDPSQNEVIKKCDTYDGYILFSKYLKEADKASFFCSQATCDFNDPACERKSEVPEIPMYFKSHQVVVGVPQGLPIHTRMVINITEGCTLEIMMNRLTVSDMDIRFLVCKSERPRRRQDSNADFSCLGKRKLNFTNVETSFMTIKFFDNSTFWFKFQPSYPTPFFHSTVINREESITIETGCNLDLENRPAIKYFFNHSYYLDEIVYEGVHLMLPITKYGFINIKIEEDLKNGSMLVKPKISEETKNYCNFMDINCNAVFNFPSDRLVPQPNENTDLKPTYYNNDTNNFDPEHPEEIRKCNTHAAYKLFDKFLPEAEKAAFICSNAACDFTYPSCKRTSELKDFPMYITSHVVVFGIPQGLPIETRLKIQLSSTCYLEVSMNRTQKTELSFKFLLCNSSECTTKEEFSGSNIQTSFMAFKISNTSQLWFKFQPSNPKPFALNVAVEREKIVTIETGCQWEDPEKLPTVTYMFNHTYYPGEIVHEGVALMVPVTKYGFIDPVIVETLKNGSFLVKPADKEETKYYCDFIGFDCGITFIYSPERDPTRPPIKFDPSYYKNRIFDLESPIPYRFTSCDLYRGYTLYRKYLNEADDAAFTCSKPKCDYKQPFCGRRSEKKMYMYYTFQQVIFGVPQGLPQFTIIDIHISKGCAVEITINQTGVSEGIFSIYPCDADSCRDSKQFSNMETSFLTIKIYNNNTMWILFRPSNPTPYNLNANVEGEMKFMVPTSCPIGPIERKYPYVKYIFNHFYFPGNILYDGMVLMLPMIATGFNKLVIKEIMPNENIVIGVDTQDENTKYICEVLEVNCSATWTITGNRTIGKQRTPSEILIPSYFNPVNDEPLKPCDVIQCIGQPPPTPVRQPTIPKGPPGGSTEKCNVTARYTNYKSLLLNLMLL